MTVYIEDYLPVVKYQGLNTKKNIVGEGNLSITGTSTFTGVATFTATPVFSAGTKPNVISGSGATVTLTAAQSGSVVLFDRAAGIVFTLPAPSVGLTYTFINTVTITSGSAEIDTSSGSVFIQGSVVLGTDNVASKSFLGNGTSHVKIASNGTTTGGILGGEIVVRCVSATVWSVNGNLAASGTLATPFA